MHLAAVAVVLGIATTVAFAEPPGVTPQLKPVPDEPIVESYRPHTAGADGFALFTLAVGGHAQLGHPRRVPARRAARPPDPPPAGAGLGSLAMRAGIPLTALLLLAWGNRGSCRGDDVTCGLGLFYAGLIGGTILASVLDTALLAKGDVRPARGWGPAVAPSHGGVTLGVAGAC